MSARPSVRSTSTRWTGRRVVAQRLALARPQPAQAAGDRLVGTGLAGDLDLALVHAHRLAGLDDDDYGDGLTVPAHFGFGLGVVVAEGFQAQGHVTGYLAQQVVELAFAEVGALAGVERHQGQRRAHVGLFGLVLEAAYFNPTQLQRGRRQGRQQQGQGQQGSRQQ